MAIWHVAPLRFAPAFRTLGECEHSWLRYNNKLYYINCTKCRISFLYEMSDFIFVRNVWFRVCTKCLVLAFVRDVVCTKCRAPGFDTKIESKSWLNSINSSIRLLSNGIISSPELFNRQLSKNNHVMLKTWSTWHKNQSQKAPQHI